MGYPRWAAMHLDGGDVVVGECKDGEREYVEVARFDTGPEAHAFIGLQRTNAHTRRTLRWRREVRAAEAERSERARRAAEARWRDG